MSDISEVLCFATNVDHPMLIKLPFVRSAGLLSRLRRLLLPVRVRPAHPFPKCSKPEAGMLPREVSNLPFRHRGFTLTLAFAADHRVEPMRSTRWESHRY